VLTEHGVPIAPRTFYAWVVRAPSKRSLWDATITAILASYYEPDRNGRRKPESLYGWLKMWAHLQREGIPVAKSTVERLMRRHGWQGVRRQRTVRTTIPDPTAARPRLSSLARPAVDSLPTRQPAPATTPSTPECP
jgi:putative transposase